MRFGQSATYTDNEAHEFSKALVQFASAHSDSGFDPAIIAQTFERAQWLSSSHTGLTNLERSADVYLLRGALRPLLDTSHPEYGHGISPEDIGAAYRCVSTFGSLIDAARSAGLPAPDFRAVVYWSEFDATFSIDTSGDVTNAWALVNAAVTHNFDEASRLAVTGELGFIARLALAYESQRYGDCIDIAASVVGGDVHHDIADAVAARAHAHLGEFDQALARVRMLLSRTNLPALLAHGELTTGLVWRAKGDSERASQHIANSLAHRHTAAAHSAMMSTESIRITSRDIINGRTSKYDVSTEPDPKLKARAERERMKAEWARQAAVLLERQVGMDEVKAQVKRIVAAARVQEEKRRRGGSPLPSNYNSLLLGPPGTGKSTIVNYLALQFASLGIVDSPEVVLLDKSKLVSNVVGGTAIKVNEALDAGEGHVIFIDEMYSIVQGDGSTTDSNTDSFGMEAIDTLVGKLETMIGKAVVIGAGYEQPMTRLMRTNEGLNSRFPRRVVFQSATPDMIAEIALRDARERGYTLSSEARALLADDTGIMRRAYMPSNESGKLFIDVLGNGRFARNIIERAVEEHAMSLAEHEDMSMVSDDALSTLSKAHVERALTALIDQVVIGGST